MAVVCGGSNVFWFQPGQAVVVLPDGGYSCDGVGFTVGVTNTERVVLTVGEGIVLVGSSGNWWGWFIAGFGFALTVGGFALSLRVVRNIGRPSPEL